MPRPIYACNMHPSRLDTCLEQTHQEADSGETGKIRANCAQHHHGTPEEEVEGYKLPNGEFLEEIVGWPEKPCNQLPGSCGGCKWDTHGWPTR